MAGGRRTRPKSTHRSVSAGGPSKGLHKPASVSTSVSCAVCTKVVSESTAPTLDDGDDALQCESCKSWFHRWCTGVSTVHYSTLSVSDEPFLCFVCLQAEFRSSVGSLKETIGALRLEIDSLKANCSCRDDSVGHSSCERLASTQRVTAATQPPLASSHSSSDSRNGVSSSSASTVSRAAHAHSRDSKFNLVVFGLKESPMGTQRRVRFEEDIKAVSSVLVSAHPSITEHSFRDCFRLGKYSTDRCRPLLVTLSRSSDVFTILGNRRSLADHPGISVKPDLSPDDRRIESLLLKQRRVLISSGTNSKDIRLHGNSLSIKGKKYGSVVNFDFQLCCTPFPSDSPPPPVLPVSNQ